MAHSLATYPLDLPMTPTHHSTMQLIFSDLEYDEGDNTSIYVALIKATQSIRKGVDLSWPYQRKAASKRRHPPVQKEGTTEPDVVYSPMTYPCDLPMTYPCDLPMTYPYNLRIHPRNNPE